MRSRRLQLVALGCLLSCGTRWPAAAELSPDISQYAHRAWKVTEGFTGGRITAITQDHDGYLWLGTESGVSRFDGVRVVPWRPPNGEHLPDEWITGLYTARDGTVWIGSRTGLASWDGIRLVRYPGLDQFGVYQLLMDHEGTVWMAAFRPPLTYVCTLRHDHASCDAQGGKFGDYVRLFVDRTGNVWAAASGGIWQFKEGPHKQYEVNPSSVIHSLSETPEGRVIVVGDDGLKQLDNAGLQPVALPIDLQKWHPQGMLRDRRGALWISTRDHGLLHFHQGRVDFFDRTDGLSGDDALQLFEDKEGNVWVTTETGLDRFRALSAITYSLRQGIQGAVSAVAGDSKGNVWFTASAGLYEWRHGEMIAFRAPKMSIGNISSSELVNVAIRAVSIDGLPSSLMGSLLVDHQGHVWVGSRLTPGYLAERNFFPVKSIAPGVIFSMVEDREGDLWIAHQDKGLLRRSPAGEIQRFPFPEAPTGWGVPLAVSPADDGLWIGSYSGAIWHLINGKFEKVQGEDVLPSGPVKDIHIRTDGTAWISSQGGLGRIIRRTGFDADHEGRLTV